MLSGNDGFQTPQTDSQQELDTTHMQPCVIDCVLPYPVVRTTTTQQEVVLAEVNAECSLMLLWARASMWKLIWRWPSTCAIGISSTPIDAHGYYETVLGHLAGHMEPVLRTQKHRCCAGLMLPTCSYRVKHVKK